MEKATEDERDEFITWTCIRADVAQLVHKARARGFNEGHDFAKKAEKARRTLEPKREVRNSYAQRGERIRTARKERGLTAKQLAELAGVVPNVVSMVEHARLTKSGGPAAGRPAYAKLEAALGLVGETPAPHAPPAGARRA